MPQLLLELFSEEIPARMQAGAARDLERLTREKLAAAELEFDALRAFAGPRRLTLVVDGLPAAQAHRTEERKGPRVGAPEAAVEGFLRSAGVAREDLVERDGVWFAQVARGGRPTAPLLAELVVAIVRGFPWPKSMTWGSGDLRWVRPLQRILCVFDRVIVPLSIDGLESGDLSEGHRVMGARRPFRARDFDEYREALLGHFVVPDAAERRRRIVEGARALCQARGLSLVEDEGLADELAGLAEWPVPLLGDMDPRFLDLPPEVIRTTMRSHQRYFAVREASGALAPRFVVIANVEAPDGGAVIAAGNARVLAARLADARFFWEEDRKRTLADMVEKLRGVTFHAKLGSVFDRAERISALSAEIARVLGADAQKAALAGRLAKADLASGMVGEFPELQGIMGGYYAAAEGLDPAIAAAIRDHYKPLGPSDTIPGEPVAASVALADKLDMLVNFFRIGEKPTGARDPFALRRMALGVARIAQGQSAALPLRPLIAKAGGPDAPAEEVLSFLLDRLKGLLRNEGRTHDACEAIFALGGDDLRRLAGRVRALDAFLVSDSGANLLAGFRRASNILEAEAKKGPLPDGPARPLPGAPDEERALIAAVEAVRPVLDRSLAAEDFAGALAALARLRAPVDAFFEKVLVNSDVPEERENRLRLLAEAQGAMRQVADFSRIAG
jgi:glycyl-tRNA synthetase beta chain